MSNSFDLYPNPANNTVNISFELKKDEDVTMEIYNMQGARVATPIIGNKTKGKHKVTLNTGNMSSGMYFVKLNYGEEMITKKFIKK